MAKLSTNAIATYDEEKSREGYHEPARRRGHMAVRLQHYVVMFGGMDLSAKALPCRVLSCRVIWLYNLYTEMWTKDVIPVEAHAPKAYRFACAVEINKDIYMFGGETENRLLSKSLWKLIVTKNGGFAWRKIKANSNKPSPRWGHSAWVFENKLWIFGGCVRRYRWGEVADNELFSFDTSRNKWTHPECTGQIPPPGRNHATTVAGDKVWLYGGFYPGQYVHCGDLHELDMQSLTWTIIDTDMNKPPRLIVCILTAVTENTLVLQGFERQSSSHSLRNTWILDLSSMSWRQHKSKPSETDYDYPVPQRRYQSCVGINSDVVVLGGYWHSAGRTSTYPNSNITSVIQENVVSHVRLERRSLQDFALKIIHKHRNVLPWKQSLPQKLTEPLDIPEDEEDCGNLFNYTEDFPRIMDISPPPPPPLPKRSQSG